MGLYDGFNGLKMLATEDVQYHLFFSSRFSSFICKDSWRKNQLSMMVNGLVSLIGKLLFLQQLFPKPSVKEVFGCSYLPLGVGEKNKGVQP